METLINCSMTSPEAKCQKGALVKEFAYPVSPTDKFGTNR